MTYDTFVVPSCRKCLEEGRVNTVVRIKRYDTIRVFADPNPSKLKPDLVFFGESIQDSIKGRSYGPTSHQFIHELICANQTGLGISKTVIGYL